MPHQTVEMEGTCFLFQTDNDKILIADMFACRLQVDDAWVKKQHSQTLVSAMLGIFRESQKTWEEFLSLVQ